MCVWVPVYWHANGPANFLWASDVAVFVVLFALWSERSLPNSMMAIGVAPFEIAWTVDFIAGSRLIGMADYMFDAERSVFVRSLALFHVALPVVMVFLLRRLGYDRRAWWATIALTLVLLPGVYVFTDPADNINLVFGLGREPQTRLDPLLYLVLEMSALAVFVYLPAHLILRRLFPPSCRAAL